ncbi:DNA excision repair protein ERCC-6-like 2 isoform X1 [Hydractinia symbiolongicarpus]|uniref:DNA excision repair protein ERCC-6-like 2 isoform X1 n=2 Tax=Hydractinia symbiolongicarpus TaxID=13093 RepID=UPI00254BFD9C|nr:DNA excision repair protein ERCC-6-like 2 isoform X1 [Hydractinia symbiolongicarpus]
MMECNLYAEKDRYLTKYYADSSDEDENGNGFKRYKLFKLKKQAVKRVKSPRKQNTIKDADEFAVQKPSLTVEPTSPKTTFILDGDFMVPASINQYLREYQRDGVMFLWQHFKENNGCILADDMGLGKTIQVISLFAAVLKKTGYKEADSKKMPNYIFLVVAPTSVLYNWLDELSTWGYFKTGKFHRKSKDEVIDLVEQGKLEVVLTTHETMRIYIETLCMIKWSAVIFDEAHRIKETTALVTKAAKQLNTSCRIGLTGTPLQNSLKEFWCLLDWANPGCLGTLDEFDEKFARTINLGQRFNATKRELATARKRQQELVLLHNQWLMRRTKDMIQDQLPAKDEKIVFCSLSDLQVSIYEAVLKLPKVKMLLGIDEVCRCESGLQARQCCLKYFEKRKEMFRHLQLLLKISNHAALLLPHHNQSETQKSLSKQLCEEFFKDFPILENLYKNPNFAGMSDPVFCGKMSVLQKLLNVLQKTRDKILLFSHSTTLLDILEAYVMSRGFIYRRLDGKTHAAERVVIMKEFNSDPTIFICLLSTTAGSLGLNFTGASFVIIFDPMWNPTHDQQAQDRAYRIGQQRDVRVYRFISVGTIEENMYLRQIYKQQLANTAIETSTERRYFEGVAGDKRYHGELFGLVNMFKFSKNHNSSFAQDTFNKVKHIENGVVVAKYEHVKPKNNERVDETATCADNFELQASQCIEDVADDDVVLLNPPLVCYNMESCPDKKDDDKTFVKSKSQHLYTNILDRCGGVSFVHSTKSVVGSSKREGEISKRAVHDVFWNDVHSQQLANDEQDIEESDESQNIHSQASLHNQQDAPNTTKQPVTSSGIFERVGTDMFIIGSTPPAIQKMQFNQMAQEHGFNSVKEFASHVLNSDSREWKKMLMAFYVKRNPEVKSVSSFDQIFDHSKKKLQPTLVERKRKPFAKRATSLVSDKSKKRRNSKKSLKVNFNAKYMRDLNVSDDEICESDSDDQLSKKKWLFIGKVATSTPKMKFKVVEKENERKNLETMEFGAVDTNHEDIAMTRSENSSYIPAPLNFTNHSPTVLDELLSTPNEEKEVFRSHYSDSELEEKSIKKPPLKLCSNSTSYLSPLKSASTTAVMNTFDSSVGKFAVSFKGNDMNNQGEISVLDELLESSILPNHKISSPDHQGTSYSVLDDLMSGC